MAREREEVAVERADVDAQMRDGLRRVDEHDGADAMRFGDELRDGVHRAERVRHVGQRDDLRALRQRAPERLAVELAGIIDRCRDEPRAGLRADQLPRHDVRVMLHPGDQDLVARA